LQKTHLFEAVARLLERLAKRGAVLLFLDDLHWARPTSLELLHYLARGLADLPVLVLGTYRLEEADGGQLLRPLPQSLRPLGLAEEIALERLAPEAAIALARAVLGTEPPADLLALLDTRACGSPLFIQAFIQALVEGGQLNQSQGESHRAAAVRCL
jgi:predicted ATPase